MASNMHKEKRGAINRLGWGVDGYGNRHICSSDFCGGSYVLFSPLGNANFYDCIDLLEEQYRINDVEAILCGIHQNQ